jgi:hypothetical protein
MSFWVITLPNGDDRLVLEKKVKLLFSVRLVFLPLQDIDPPVT